MQFYVQSGTVNLTMAATRRKRAIIAVLLRGSFLAKAVWEGNLCGFTRRDQLGPLAEGEHASHDQATRSLQRCLMHICFPALFGSRKTWQINSPTSAKTDWHGFYCCLGK